ncbi:hypothetical protein [Spongorhabdus nitratireducens]
MKVNNEKTSYLAWLGKIVTAEVEHPLGSRHPKFRYIYPVNYGIIPGTKA